MKTTYHYVVLRLAPDQTRGEVINVGVALFPELEDARVVTMATLNKLRALDASWDSQRLVAWTQGVQLVLEHERGVAAKIQALARFGFCESEAVGMFYAASPEELASRLQAIKVSYVSNKTNDERPKREKRTRLQTALREQFKKMHVLGNDTGDIANHLVVANVPVPAYGELKTDFVYKNGVYRITQTIDYHVAPDSVHNKLAEACVKSTAAELAMKAYGPDTLRLAVLDIPSGMEDVTDPHVDLLLAQGFEVFHYGDSASMADYLNKAAPRVAPIIDGPQNGHH